MALEQIRRVSGTAVVVPGEDIDTDRIIPARYMKVVTFDGLGEYLFRDARIDESGERTDHPLNDPERVEARILISGSNFGCGSSREHAPQAIYRAGFRGVIAESFAEIFFGNSTTLGMPCVALERSDLVALQSAVDDDPSLVVEIDVEAREVRAGDTVYPASLPDSARQGLLEGTWDPLGELLEQSDAVRARTSELGYRA